MNRIDQTLKKNKTLLSIYFTAGFPKLDDTLTILKNLEESGVDMVEIGLPFSDPLADGPVIQESSTQALKNGMTTEKLFEQLENVVCANAGVAIATAKQCSVSEGFSIASETLDSGKAMQKFKALKNLCTKYIK